MRLKMKWSLFVIVRQVVTGHNRRGDPAPHLSLSKPKISFDLRVTEQSLSYINGFQGLGEHSPEGLKHWFHFLFTNKTFFATREEIGRETP